MFCVVVFVFFFQAEDGIRDGHVTGVQTCALPIYCQKLSAALPGCGPETSDRSSAALSFWQFFAPRGASAAQNERSEERRVGKECRSRLSPEIKKKKEVLTERECR